LKLLGGQNINPLINMEIKNLLIGTLVTAFVFGAYFLGAFHGQRASIKWREFFASMTHLLTLKGFLWATALPTFWLLLFYTFVAHVRLSLGRWPEFGQQLEGWSFAFFDQATRQVAGALVSSLFILPLLLVACLFFRRWRHISVYAVAYGAAVGIAIGVMFLAPHSFLNWYID
jgi:hypothetical protein